MIQEVSKGFEAMESEGRLLIEKTWLGSPLCIIFGKRRGERYGLNENLC